MANETRAAMPGNQAGPGPAGKIRTDPIPEGVRPELELTAGPGRGKTYYLTKPLMMLGRISDVADIVIVDESASRHHAAIAHQDGAFVLLDMGSTNGTYVNGKKQDRVALQHGDEITIGSVVMTFWN